MANSYTNELSEIHIPSDNMSFFNLQATKLNKKYILIPQIDEIIVYNFDKKIFLEENIKLKDFLYYFDFHTTNNNIFFVCSGKKITLYEIENIKINIISIIESPFDNVIYGCFNPFKPNIFLSASESGFIKIYDITNYFPISLNLVMESFRKNIEIKWGKKDIGFKYKGSVMYFEYDNYKSENIKKYNSENISDFYFLNDFDDSLIIIKDNAFEIIKNNIKLIEYKRYFNFSFYLMKYRIVIMLNSEYIEGIKINDNYSITQLFKYNQNPKKIIYDLLFLKEVYLNNNEICEIYGKLSSFKLLSYSIKVNNVIEQKTINENNTINNKNINKIIYDIPLLISKDNNNYNSSDSFYRPKEKNYFKINSIITELNDVKKRSLLERKEKVKKELATYDNKMDIQNQYIFLLKLLINDNTNKDLLKIYFPLLHKNNDYLKKIFGEHFEEFEKESNYFSTILDIEENILYLNKKVKSQKEIFIEFVKAISDLKKNNENDIKLFENYLKGNDEYFENISYFNMPIDLSDEQSFYYRNLNLVRYHLKNVYEKINKKVEKEIKKKLGNIEMIKKDLLISELDKISCNIKLCFDDLKDSKDIELVNGLIISLIFALNKETFKLCYNYLKSKEKNFNKCLQLNKGEYSENSEKIFHRFEKVNIELNLIKQFYKNILPLKCFKSIFLALNGKNSYYPFEDKEFTEHFVDNIFEVLDSPVLKSLGLTDKFTMKTYFIPFIPKINFGNDCHFINDDKIIINGVFVRAGNHEIGHNFTNIIFYTENCKVSIATPRKNYLELNEGGNYLDFALFGKILKELNLEQALYILNEKNYEKSFIDFQYGFNNIKKEDLIVEGVFKGMCEDISNNLNKDFDDNAKSIFIRLNSINIGDIKINCEIRNDVLFGNTISDEDYEKLLKKYG